MNVLNLRSYRFSCRFAVLFTLTIMGIHYFDRAHAVESLQLEHIPIDSSLGCERVFFKSSQNFQGTIYVLPVVMLDTDEYGEPIVTTDVNPNASEGFNYLLNFRIFFPNDDQDMRARAHIDDAAGLPKCNFAAVKNSLNKTRPETDPIHTIAYMPLTSIEVTIPDFTSKPHLTGRKAEDAEADLIAYQGQTFNVSIPMTADEKNSILDALTRREGLQAHIRMRFKAHRQNGSLNVNIDMSQLSANFKAAAKGQNEILKADLAATLRMAMNNTSVQIESTESSSKAFNALTEQILEKVLTEVQFVTDITPKELDLATPADKNEKISVSAVADFLATKLNTKFTVRQSTAEEVATAETVVAIQAVLGDPNIRVMRVASGESTESTLSVPINKGQTFQITPATYSLQRIEYQEKVTYVTSDELRNNYVEINAVADLLTDSYFNITDIDRNGVFLAVGHWPYLPHLWFNEVVWKRIERTPVIVRNPRTKIELDRESYSRFPVFMTFSNIAGQRRMFTFEEMMSESPFWQGRYDEDTGSIVVVAKQDLGLIALRPRFKLYENNDARDFPPELIEKCSQYDGSQKMNCLFPKCVDPLLTTTCKGKSSLYEEQTCVEENTENKCGAINDSKDKAQCVKIFSEKKFEERMNCLAVYHLRSVVTIEELVMQRRQLLKENYEVHYPVRTSGRATTRQRVIFYNITLPRAKNNKSTPTETTASDRL